MSSNSEPVIIQGGMGVAVSSWQLAKAVSQMGQMGVVSGTGLDVVLSRLLQLGDLSGHLRRALEQFPFLEMVQPILDRYFKPGGKAPDEKFISHSLVGEAPNQRQLELLVVANFVEVFLAKEDHDGLVGINYLEKVQVPTLASIFGSMLAGVDYILMGAGIPKAIPGILDRFSRGESVEMPLSVAGADRDDNYALHFNPGDFTKGRTPWLKRPKFLAIISSTSLATMLSRKSSGKVNGFVVEGPTAGGHNAPPRGQMQLNDNGEPLYGERDVPNLEAIRKIGLPFWLAGSYDSPEQVSSALATGAAGVQVGTAFAFCKESGLRKDLKQKVLGMVRAGAVEVRTDPRASPTGFPFKVLELSDSISEEPTYKKRKRICDLGYLRQAFKKDDGSLGWRCPAEDVNAYLRKGGSEEETRGRKCVCNGLFANIGLGQIRKDGVLELPLVTSGDQVRNILKFLPTPEAVSYSAQDVLSRLLSGVVVPV